MSWEELRRRAAAWIADDPDPEARAELEALVAARDEAELRARFAGPLEFGTAGLRGLLGAGESRMNRAVVRRTTAGLAAWLLELDAAGARARGVAIGYDGRRLSRELAADAAGVLAAVGIPVHLSAGVCPTPLLAFAVRERAAAAGVVVTASHNPPDYNGYKVYAANGAQIVPPADAEIAARIAAQPGAASVPLRDLEEARAAGLLRPLGADVEAAYLDGLAGLSTPGGDRAIPIVTTALHGVGDRLLGEALRRAGFRAVASVPEQAEPDGAFPTVAFPNPEEEGALDLALALADERAAALVLANDPDADRLGAVVRAVDGAWVPLSGNEIGVLLGEFLLEQAADVGARRLAMTTVVSSPLLSAVARAQGARYEETLTGFKWIANRAIELEAAEGARFVFGYEEALGYTVGTLVRDKDGIGAALVLAEMAALQRAAGRTLLDELERIYRRYGLYLSGQRSPRFDALEGPRRMAAIMDGFRAASPEAVGPRAVLAVRDYQTGVRRACDGAESRLGLPASNLLAFELEGGDRILARPSGTEPKIKFYLDVREEIAADEPVAAAQARARARLDALADAFLARAGL